MAAGRFELGDFELQSGRVLPDAFLGYETHGELNADRTNVIVYPTWYAGTHETNRGAIGAGKALDPEKYFVVVPDQFCDGYSSSPSNTAQPNDRMRFPLCTPYDNVEAARQLLVHGFGIESIELVVGYSMSAQQAFHWGALHSDMVRRIAPICGSARTSPHDWLHLESLKLALQADAAWQDGDYDEQPARGLRAFVTATAAWFASQNYYRSGSHLNFAGQQFRDTSAFLDGLAQAFDDWDANDLLCMLATWQSADVSAHERFGGDLSAALGAITCPAMVMPCRTDLYFPPEDSELAVAMMPDAELRVIESDSGHLAGLPGIATRKDETFIDAGLKDLLGRS